MSFHETLNKLESGELRSASPDGAGGWTGQPATQISYGEIGTAVAGDFDVKKLGPKLKAFLARLPRGRAPTAAAAVVTAAGEYAFTWTGAAQGQHVLKAKATDNQGASTFSNPVRIWVGPLPPVPPLPLKTNSSPRATPVL